MADMRKFWCLSILAAVLLAPHAVAEEKEGSAPGIEWQPDLEKARAAAKEAGRCLVLYFTFDT
jgi:hypothetical protein